MGPIGEIAEAIRELRRRRHMRQGTVARLVGRVQSRISELEKGTHDPRLSNLIAVLEAIDARLMVIPAEQVAEVRSLLKRKAEKHNVDAYEQKPDVFDDVFVNVPSSKLSNGEKGST